jgi:serralysin
VTVVYGTTFSDSFDTGANAAWDNHLGDWMASGGVYSAQNPSAYPNTNSLVSGLIWSDFSVDVTVNNPADGSNRGGGVWLRASNDATAANVGVSGVLFAWAHSTLEMYWHVVLPGQDGYGFWPNLVEFGLADTPFSVHIEVRGDTYSAYVNGSLITSLTDNHFASGQVGLYDGNDVSEQTFDNFSVNVIYPPAVTITGSNAADVIDATHTVFGQPLPTNGQERINGRAGDDIISGLGGNDVLNGGADADTVYGGDGNDVLLGGLGDDTLVGGAGNDRLDGGSGPDVMDGGDGNDKYYVDDADDTVTDASGIDQIFTSVSFTLGVGIERLYATSDRGMTLTGNALNNIIAGGGGADTIDGGAGNDKLSGGDGFDQIVGGEGRDTIDGGLGDDTIAGGLRADILTGGDGNDTFTYQNIADSGILDTTRDIITDFDAGDIFDLSAIDAIQGGAQNQFTFIGNAAFTAKGQVRWDTTVGGDTIVEANTRGTLGADFSVLLQGSYSLSASDFLLG